MPNNAILERMLERLFASMMRGPSLNCRPHSSRQRIDMMQLARCEDVPPHRVLVDLLGDAKRVTVTGRVTPPRDWAVKHPFSTPEEVEPPREEDPATRQWQAQRALLNKLRNLSDDARTYEQDTGVSALAVGYPILSLPPGTVGGGSGRILAPIAFVPVSLTVRVGHKPGLDLACRGEGVDLVTPNPALIAWLSRQLGKPIDMAFHDEEGVEPWREIDELICQVAKLLDIAPPNLELMTSPQSLSLETVPLAEQLAGAPTIYSSAVLGLYPVANQSLLRDVQEMIAQDALDGPVRSFIDSSATLECDSEPPGDKHDDAPKFGRIPRRFSEERFIARADPFQARSVAFARTSAGLVIHGPPGTGKSQTITNIIGDHLSRGQRVLFVCDKRTALDVVFNRMAHLELGGLCAVVHDPQRDQRDLYMAIRNELELLTDIKTPVRAADRVDKLDEELQALHDELTQLHQHLMTADGDDRSLHDLTGQWLTIDATGVSHVNADELRKLTHAEFERHREAVRLILQRGVTYEHRGNAWVSAAGITLDALLNRPADELRRGLADLASLAQAADATMHPAIPPLANDMSLAEQARRRLALADELQAVVDRVPAKVREHYASLTAPEVGKTLGKIRDAQPFRLLVAQSPLDAELELVARDAPPKASQIARQMAELDAYLAVAGAWYGIFCFGARKQARTTLAGYGLQLTPAQAQRLKTFLQAWRARLVLTQLHDELTGTSTTGLARDDALAAVIAEHEQVLAMLAGVSEQPELDAPVREALADAARAAPLMEGLRRSEARAAAVERLETAASGIDLFDARWCATVMQAIRGNGAAADTFARLRDQFDTLDDVVRNRADRAGLPEPLQSAVRALLRAGVDPAAGLDALAHATLAGEIVRRIAASDALRSLDPQRIDAQMRRYRELEEQKRRLVRDAILHQWKTRQRERLLAGTGGRLNSEGARLRQRLFVRGTRAMRLRQMIAVGESIEGGDPLFDMCPVWMASPETVAQVFPRLPLFDVLVFDEASQCRLEEALPVLTRAQRVVIAGDPKQLPPTRFFESTVAESDQGEIETEQDLFEAQQGEIEDLLAAALNLDIQQSYLDVHYRSKNADLIEFSNEQFYGSRLQAIPGHPRNRAKLPPITMHRADGVYDKRCNLIEAQYVCRLIGELLDHAQPPSIGVACFNLTQRDLINELLEERAAEDSGFAAKLARSREQRGEGSFEGLFVKNLESVQGDERDHIIISTTYGPNPEGRFYRRFGPLGQAGGWRRLNVLITRAREQVHLVSSIPREAYMATTPVPEDAMPGGGWLLLAYLRFAEDMAEMYAQTHRVLEQAQAGPGGRIFEHAIPPVSTFARGLAQQLAQGHDVSSDVHWGNEGFRIDAALHHPHKAEEVTIGLLCDFATFVDAPDPVEWDIFRSAIHESQGWQLQRIWSPMFFRDPQRVMNQIQQQVQQHTT
jgi:hypothetical protein